MTDNLQYAQLSKKLVPKKAMTALGAVEYVEIGDGRINESGESG